VARYDLEVRPSVWKDVAGVPKRDLKKILEKIEALQDHPRPPGCVKLSGQEYYRIRQGDFRIIYEVHDERLIVVVVRVRNRREAYR
jgi:mRNA interferase RelE/StbE